MKIILRKSITIKNENENSSLLPAGAGFTFHFSLKKLLLLISLLICMAARPAYAQVNLVPNPSFEEFDSIPFYTADSIFYKYLYYPKYWFHPVSCGFHSYFNAALNYKDTAGGSTISGYGVPQNPWSYTMPVDGVAQTGFILFSLMGWEGIRNYWEVQLSDTLTGNRDYCVSFYLTTSDSSQLSIDRVGARFTRDSLTHYTPDDSAGYCYLPGPPQLISPAGNFFDIRDKWYYVSGMFTAAGGERFITIGNFNNDSNTNYVWLSGPPTGFGPDTYLLLDMVTVTECDTEIKPADAGNDTAICQGDSIMLGPMAALPGYEFEWLPAYGLSNPCIKNPMAAPLQTTTYTLQQSYYSAYQSSDMVTVSVVDCNVPPPENASYFIPNMFSPNADGHNDVFYVRGQNITGLHLQIYNRWGEQVFETGNISQGWDGNCSGKKCADGVYYYVAEITFGNGETVSRKGNVTLLR